MVHVPVLKKEVLEYLDPKANENFIDCTAGEGGHTFDVLKKNGPQGKVLSIEIDKSLYQKLKAIRHPLRQPADGGAEKEFEKRLILVNDSYTNLKEIVKKYNFEPVAGILLDLGFSSWHLEKSGRGFSFLRNEPLDMRYNRNFENELTAGKIINHWPQKKMEEVLKKYGEERFAKRIAQKILEKRKEEKIKTTFQLVDIIKRATPAWYQHKKIHFATKTFQALRIAVNDELNNLKKVLPQALEILEPEGRLIIISFHSLEDRIVKNFLKEKNKEKLLKILTKKPIRASKKEIITNRRSRSAKLRAAIKYAT